MDLYAGFSVHLLVRHERWDHKDNFKEPEQVCVSQQTHFLNLHVTADLCSVKVQNNSSKSIHRVATFDKHRQQLIFQCFTMRLSRDALKKNYCPYTVKLDSCWQFLFGMSRCSALVHWACREALWSPQLLQRAGQSLSIMSHSAVFIMCRVRTEPNWAWWKCTVWMDLSLRG